MLLLAPIVRKSANSQVCAVSGDHSVSWAETITSVNMAEAILVVKQKNRPDSAWGGGRK